MEHKDLITVNFQRLLELSYILPEKEWQWDGVIPFTLDEVKDKIAKGMSGTAQPYGDTWKHPVKEIKDRNYHISRIIYLAQHPEEIDGIEVDNQCYYDGYSTSILPACEIVDGWHRIAAGIILDLKTIKIYYGGRKDIEDYLTENTNMIPDEII